MKKISLLLTTLAIFTVSYGQSMRPMRSAFNTSQKTVFQLTSDSSLSEAGYRYSVPKNLVAIVATDENQPNGVIFFATKKEFEFIKEQSASYAMQITLDDRVFVGYCKIVWY